MVSEHPFSLGAQLRFICEVVTIGEPTRPPRIVPSMRPGAASVQVIAYLRKDGGFRMACEIRQATGRSHAAVSWALLFLRSRGMVECVPDCSRNQRYLRYRARQ